MNHFIRILTQLLMSQCFLIGDFFSGYWGLIFYLEDILGYQFIYQLTSIVLNKQFGSCLIKISQIFSIAQGF